MAVGVHELGGVQLHAAVGHGVQRGLGQLVHLHEPLQAQAGFDHRVGALAEAHLVHDVLHLHQVAAGLQVLGDLLAHHEAVLAHIEACGLAHGAIGVQRVDDLQPMALADLPVVDVVRGRHLQAARAELHVDVVVEDHRHGTLHHRDDAPLPLQVRVARVVRVNAHRGVAQDGLRTRGGDGDPLVVRAFDLVADVVQAGVHLLVDHLLVADGGERLGIPVHHALAAVHEPFLVQVDEDIDDRLAQGRLHGETRTLPVTAGAELLELFQDHAAILLLPGPGMLQELLPAELLLGQSFVTELLHHLGLGGDGGMVHPRHPAGVLPLHAGAPHQHVLDGVVQHVPHVQHAGHVGRGNGDGEGLALVGLAVEVATGHPVTVPPVLAVLRIVPLGKLHLSCVQGLRR